jgi:hypothetical protein
MARRGFPFGKVAAGVAVVGAGAFLLTRDSVLGGGCTESALRKRAVDIARGEVGNPLLPKYLADAAPAFVGEKPEWCGIFALWVLRQAGITDKQWKVGLGFLLTKPHPLPTTDNPQPGDIAYFEQYQHQAMVASVSPDTVELINGNGQGARVTVSNTPRTKAKAYYSIAPLLADAIAKGCK